MYAEYNHSEADWILFYILCLKESKHFYWHTAKKTLSFKSKTKSKHDGAVVHWCRFIGYLC